MSLAVFLTAFGGVAISLLAVTHQTLRLRAVRNAEVHTDSAPEDFVDDKPSVVFAGPHEAARAVEIDDAIHAFSQAAIEHGWVVIADEGIKKNHVKSEIPGGGIASRGKGHLVKLADGSYEWRYRTPDGELVQISGEFDSLSAAVGSASRQPAPLRGGGVASAVLSQGIHVRSQRRDPAAPARATDRPSKVR